MSKEIGRSFIFKWKWVVTSYYNGSCVYNGGLKEKEIGRGFIFKWKWVVTSKYNCGCVYNEGL